MEAALTFLHGLFCFQPLGSFLGFASFALFDQCLGGKLQLENLIKELAVCVEHALIFTVSRVYTEDQSPGASVRFCLFFQCGFPSNLSPWQKAQTRQREGRDVGAATRANARSVRDKNINYAWMTMLRQQRRTLHTGGGRDVVQVVSSLSL